MLKVVDNRKARRSIGRRVPVICSLFAIAFASTARANEYQYPIMFDPSSQSPECCLVVWEQLTRQAYRFSMLQLDLQIPTVLSPLQRRVWEWKLMRRLVLEAANNIVDYIK